MILESKSLEIGSKRSLGEQETASNQRRLRAPSGRIRSMPAGSKNRAHEMALKTCSSAPEGANETNGHHALLPMKAGFRKLQTFDNLMTNSETPFATLGG